MWLEEHYFPLKIINFKIPNNIYLSLLGEHREEPHCLRSQFLIVKSFLHKKKQIQIYLQIKLGQL